MTKPIQPCRTIPTPPHPSNPPQCPFHEFLIQQLFLLGASCSFSLDVLHGTCWKSLIYAKNEDRGCWWWLVGLKQSPNLQSLLSVFSIPWCVQKTREMNDSFRLNSQSRRVGSLLSQGKMQDTLLPGGAERLKSWRMYSCSDEMKRDPEYEE